MSNFYGPASTDRGHIVFAGYVLSVHLSVCPQKTLTLAITFEGYVVKLLYFTCTLLVVRLLYGTKSRPSVKVKYKGHIFSHKKC